MSSACSKTDTSFTLLAFEGLTVRRGWMMQSWNISKKLVVLSASEPYSSLRAVVTSLENKAKAGLTFYLLKLST